MSGRAWDAGSYDQVGSPMTDMAAAVVERAEIAPTDAVLDAGCGTGRVTDLLLARVPSGMVVGVDADPDMVRVAQANLGTRAPVVHGDITAVGLDDLGREDPFDLVVSTATFHWVLDHDALFTNLARLLRPGGRLVAQCGGAGNIATLRAAGDAVAATEPYASHFAGWSAPWYYANVEDTERRLAAAGFVDATVWLQPWPVTPDDPVEYTTTVTYGAQVQRLPESLRTRFVDDVLARLERPITVDYLRLNIDATRA